MALHKREYSGGYEEYLDHQKAKLDKSMRHLRVKWINRKRKFIKKFRKFIKHIRGRKVLCLGARLGDEVAAFRELGFTKSVGIDLNPGPNNRYVTKGDFHNIPFDNDRFGAVYSNCLDHAWELKTVSREIKRVLKKDGVFICDVSFCYGEHEHLVTQPQEDQYEAVIWDSLDDFVKEFEDDFEVVDQIGGRKTPDDTNHHIVVVMKEKK